MVLKVQERTGDGSLPAQFHFLQAVGEVTAGWLKPDQRVVYWSDRVLKGHSHSVLRNLFLAPGQESRWCKQLTLSSEQFLTVLGLTLNYFPSLTCKLDTKKKMNEFNLLNAAEILLKLITAFNLLFLLKCIKISYHLTNFCCMLYLKRIYYYY